MSTEEPIIKIKSLIESQNLVEALTLTNKELKIHPQSSSLWNIKGSILIYLNQPEGAIEAFDTSIEMDSSNPKPWFNKANSLMNLQKTEEALVAFKQFTEITSDKSQLKIAWYRIGQIYHLFNKFSESIEAYNFSLEIEPDDDAVMVSKGLSLLKLMKYQEALDCFEKATGLNDENDSAWNNKGYSLLVLKKYHDSIQAFDKALEINPKNHIALNSKAVALSCLNRDQESIQAYDQALDITPTYIPSLLNKLSKYIPANSNNSNNNNEIIEICNMLIKYVPDNEQLWYNKGLAYYNLGMYEEAIDSFNGALDINPDYHEALNNKGNAYSNLKQYDEALEAFDKCLSINKNNFRCWYNKGNVFFETNKLDQALEAFSEAICLNKNYDKAWNNKGLVFIELGKFESALEIFNQALEIEPNNISLLKNKSHCLVDLQRYEEAIEIYDIILELNEDDSIAYYNKALALININELEEAIKLIAKSIELDPDSDFALNNKGYLLFSFQNYQEAAKAFQSAIEKNPKNISPRYNLASLYYYLSNIGDSSREIDKLLEIQPDNLAALNLKGRIKFEEEDYETALFYFQKAASIDLNNMDNNIWELYVELMHIEFSYGPSDRNYKSKAKAILRKLNRIRNASHDKILEVYLLYFEGYINYKLGNLNNAISKLSFTQKTKSKAFAYKASKELYQHIWFLKNKSLIKWWLSSPTYRWLKRISFLIVVILLPYTFITNIYLSLIIFFILISPKIRLEKIIAKKFGLEVEMKIKSPPYPDNDIELSPMIMDKMMEDLNNFSEEMS